MERGLLLTAIKENIIQGRRDQSDEGIDESFYGQPGAAELVEEAIKRKVGLKEILASLEEGMAVVGKLYTEGKYFIPDMLAAAEAVGVAMELLAPHFAQEDKRKGKFVIATVENDQHDIGKNIVATMLRGAGYQVIDLGTGVPAAQIVEAIRQEKASFLGLSALLDTTMRHMEETLTLLEKEGLRSQVKVLIGGAPTSPAFAQKIGADRHCKDAFAGVEAANFLSET